MRCRTHSSNQSDGVCAACLRERLTALAAEHDAESRSEFSLLPPIWGNPSPKKSDFDAIVLKPSVPNSSFLAVVMRRWRKNKKISPRVSPVKGRGMSPVRKEEKEEALASRMKGRRQRSPVRLSSYAVCLSPMLRPIAGNRRSYGMPDTVFAGDRSRKLVDLGKAW